MKQFMEPEVKLEMFYVEDVITTSFDGNESEEDTFTCPNQTPVG